METRGGERKMTNRPCKIFVVAVAAFLILGAGIAQAGVLGNPTGTMGRGNVSLGVEYDYRRGLTDNEIAVGTDPDGEVEFSSNRYLARAGIGAFDWLDLYFRIGAADLGFPGESIGDDDFSGSTRFAIGGGFNLRLFETHNDQGVNARALFSAQGLRFSSHGNMRFKVPNTTDVYRVFENEYTWNEIDLGLMLALTTPSLDSGGNVFLTPYVGIEKTFIDGKNERAEFLSTAGQRTSLGMEEVEFADDGLTFRPVLGLEVNMPHKYAIAFEVTIIDSKEFSFGVGISQISGLRRTAVKDRATDHKM
jgi:hypothetical protein